jgi:hypothetical protein
MSDLISHLEDPIALFLITTHLSNKELRVLSRTSLWLIVREFAQNQQWWHMRTLHLILCELRTEAEWIDEKRPIDWKNTYLNLSYHLNHRIALTVRLGENVDGIVTISKALCCDDPDYDSQEVYSSQIWLDIRDGKQHLHDGLSNSFKLGSGLLSCVYTLISALKEACTGHRSIDVVLCAIQDQRLRVSKNDGHEILELACRTQADTEIVRLLLEDGRFDPVDDVSGDQLLWNATCEGEMELIRLLTKDGRIDIIKMWM